LSNHLLFEYEEVGKRNAVEMGLSLEDIDDVLDALCAAAELRQLEPAWIPRLSDPDDEPLLQMAVEAKVPIIITRNLVHLKPAESFGIEVLTPARFLVKLRTTV
jgi:predicted nucleic acid-binding protein